MKTMPTIEAGDGSGLDYAATAATAANATGKGRGIGTGIRIRTRTLKGRGKTSETNKDRDRDKGKDESTKHLALALHLADSIRTITGCKVLFENLTSMAGHYMFEPKAEDTYLVISLDTILKSSFADLWQIMLGMASYHLSIGPNDWRRLFHIEASYKDGGIVGPYSDNPHLDSNAIFLSGLLLQEYGICPLGFCGEHKETHAEKARVWMVRHGLEVMPTISGDLYHIIS